MVAICFDWDGTLADSLDTFFRANRRLLAVYGRPFDVDRYRRAYSPDWRRLYRRLGIPPHRLAEANALWQRHFDPSGARLVPGVADALRALVRARARIGIVTATRRAIVKPQLERFGLADLVEVLVTVDDTPATKPDPAPLRLALARFGLSPDDLTDRASVWYVGDAPDDMRMARRLGVPAIGIPSILSRPASLRAAGAVEIWPSVPAWAASFLARLGAEAPERP
jgi:HAD superfamily hydrolase (TIGR01509 family)